ncbi:SWIM zinc finger family protein [Streptomyces clavuligerus]|uniref:Zinc finger SWIM domain protein n=1 Tax=Streptomyces clavuligerus TaxID=1901 RepID=E2Q9K4_STRCL|nr:SWIM zinc finger family protein [Streptomyces clavuligerus]AXU15885.1 SWIM zinc finger family protein [Streptomyces clavuligerus]EFG05624.1 Zinc finger SWIM domain protein [Streptomyces clavuligerus]MBY6306010.1 SWIM zinc finger family protein [Streptomyces clavuligerus]QPJ91998.1 SWIM zinc finger family protein [Streptomyces clavuligerus]QPL65877.1 SWIM zinc finger family protein [Streptomyces clavuligerus]
MTRTMQALAYARPSALESGAGGGLLGLETSGGLTPAGAQPHPAFFSGFLASPLAAARALLAVADVAAARYTDPTPRPLLDPVVTGNGDRLRFESFSGCCGVYARLDVLRDGLEGRETAHGTTNVDVNNPLREALSRMTGDSPLHLRVGPGEMAVTTLDGPVVEKKVPLPDRWLRGFAEAQVATAGFELRAELPGAEAVRFLRSLPRSFGRASRGTTWVVPARGALRPTTRPVAGAVCLPGPERLTALHRVLRHATALRVYGPSGTGSAPAPAAWEVMLPGMRLTLTLSPDTSRGFSGEGGVLEALSTPEAEQDAELISVLLAWEPVIDPAELADRSGLPVERVRAALVRLGTAGRVGYDVADAAYFHRELPYDARRAERHNPRLLSARELVASGAVTLGADGETAAVASGARVYRVGERGGRLWCTCAWWAEHQGGRGPCKHALAVRMVRRGATAADGDAGTRAAVPAARAAGADPVGGAR